MAGKLIRLFLVDGNPKGLRTLEISNMTIYTTIFPRSKLKQFLHRDESRKAGCYILIGHDLATPEKLTVYVGEGETVGDRLKSHSTGRAQKEFWDEAIVFTSKDDYLTKTQIQYLESELCRLAEEAGEIILDNGNRPTKPVLSEVDNAEMEQFLNAKAKMKIQEDQYVVLKGSTAVVENRPSAGNSIKSLRQRLIDKGIIKLTEQGNVYRFEEDYIFTSPSYAAAAISGGHENGRRQWKHRGKSLSQIEKEEIK